MRKQKLTAILISVLFIITLLPLTAGAHKFSSWTTIKGGTIYAHNLQEGASLSIKEDTTLILDTNLSLCRIDADGSITVKDTGGYKLTVWDETGSCFSADGTITLDGGEYEFINRDTDIAKAITANDNITIMNADVYVESVYTAMLALGADIKISDSHVKVIALKDEGATGIRASRGGSVFIENSEVSVEAGTTGIEAMREDGKGGTISIKNSNVVAIGGENGIDTFYGLIDIKSGSVYAEGGRYGIAAFRDFYSGKGSSKIQISGGNINSAGGTAGIFIDTDNLKISGGTLVLRLGITGTEPDLSEYDSPIIYVGNENGENLEKWDGSTGLSNYGFLYISSGSTHMVNVGSLSVREEPSPDGQRIGGLTADARVTVIEDDGEWSKIEYGDGYGYVMSKYLTPITSSDATNTIYSVSVSISIPDDGENPAYDAESPEAAVKNVTWYRKVMTAKGIEEFEEMPKSAKFKAGKEYALKIELSTEAENDSFAPAENLDISLNGSLLPHEYILDASENALTIYYDFEIMETKPQYENPFVDVDETDDYYDAVMWAYYSDPQVTKGVDETHFGPDSTVTRGQCVTFLWRAEGCPEPKSNENPFTDVKKSDYYYDAVLWAVEQGITYGTTDTTFSPDDTLTTQHIITFMYRCQNPGLDGWDGDAATWAGKSYGGKPFGVNIAVNNKTDCPRWCVVQFLFELYVPRL